MITIPTHTEVVLLLRQTQHFFPLQATIVLNSEAFGLLRTTLGGNEDDTVSGTATIKSCSCGTFQHRHVFHVVGVDHTGTITEVITVVQAVVAKYRRVDHWHTVDDI